MPNAARQTRSAKPPRRRLSLRWPLIGVLLLIAGVSGFMGLQTSPEIQQPLNAASASVSPGTVEIDGVRYRPIETYGLGQRTAGRNPLRHEVDELLPEPDPATWREIRLRMMKGNGLWLWIELLRPVEWIEAAGAAPGKSLYLDLYEFGAAGEATVTYLGPCPKIESGSGSIVTGRFKHESDESIEVLNLRLDGQKEPTCVTANHRYWSIDRQEFIDAGHLRQGERVDTDFGIRNVVSVTPTQYTGFLYNLETTEHVYRVGSLGTLVHNFCLHRIFPDKLGRVRSAVAHVTLADLGSGSATNAATRRAARALGHSTDDAGHLIGKLLGGPGGKNSGNFFAQNPHINRGQFAQLEQRVAAFVRNGDDVWIRVTPQYAGNSTRASGVLYQVRVNGQTIISYPFLN